MCIDDGRLDAGHILPVVDQGPTCAVLVLLVDEDAEDLRRRLEPHRHLLDPQVRGQAAVGAQGQVQLIKVLSGDKGRVQLDRQLVKLAIQAVLHDVTLAATREERDNLAVLKFVNIDGLVDLRQPNHHRRSHLLCK